MADPSSLSIIIRGRADSADQAAGNLFRSQDAQSLLHLPPKTGSFLCFITSPVFFPFRRLWCAFPLLKYEVFIIYLHDLGILFGDYTIAGF